MLLKQTVFYLPAQLIGPIAQVVAAIVWTHWLPPAAFGVLALLIASQDLVFLVCLYWWTQYTMRYLGGFDPPTRQGFLESEASVLAISVLAQGVLTLLTLVLLRQSLTLSLVAAAVTFVASRSVLMHLCERARIQGRIGMYTIGQIAISIGGFIAALCIVLSLGATLANVLFGYALAQIVGLVVMWRGLDLATGTWFPRQVIVAAAFKYGAPLLVAGGFSWIAQNAIRVVVEHGAGEVALGLVALGWSLGLRLSSTLAMLVVTATFPQALERLHRGSREEAFGRIALGGVLLMGLIVPAVIGMRFLADPFAIQFVAAPFRDTTIAILPYTAAAGAIRNIRVHVADPVFLLIERPRINTMINAIDAGFILVGCAAGLSLGGGLVGAVAGALVATSLSALIAFGLAYRLAGFVFPFVDALRIVAASAAMALVLHIIQWSDVGPLARMAADIALGAAVYAVAIIALYPKALQGARRRLADAWG